MRIVHVFTIVVAEGLLVQVAEQVKWFHAHIGAADPALEQAPEVLKAVGMHAAIYIFRSVVNHLMRVIASKPVIGKQRVSVQRGSSFHVLFHFALQNLLTTATYDHGANFTAALKNAHNCGFVFPASSGDPSLSLA